MLTWSDNLATDIEIVDQQHQRLFQMANQFAAETEGQADAGQVVDFLIQLKCYAAVHFQAEERWMRKMRYPLLEYHAEMHLALVHQLNHVETQAMKGTLENAVETVTVFATSWLNHHIAKDDLAFADFCKNTETVSPGDFLNQHCEVCAMDNTLLGLGQIIEINPRYILVDIPAEKDLPVHAGNVVKVIVGDEDDKSRVLIARVMTAKDHRLVIFNSKVITSPNKRNHQRVVCDVGLLFTLKGVQHTGKMLDISVGGILLEVDFPLMLKDTFEVSFELLNHAMGGDCEVVRLGMQGHDSSTYQYGCTCTPGSAGMRNIISEFMFFHQNRQRVGPE